MCIWAGGREVGGMYQVLVWRAADGPFSRCADVKVCSRETQKQIPSSSVQRTDGSGALH